MALIEVDDVELAKLKAERDAFAPSKAILDKLGANPSLRARTLALMKEAMPNLSIPEVDAKEDVLKAVDGIRKELEADRKKLAEERAADEKQRLETKTAEEIEKGRRYLRSQGCTDEGITSVETFMTNHNLTDYKIAFAAWEKDQPKDEPIVPQNMGKTWDLFAAAEEDDADIKAAVRQPRGPAQHNALMRWQNKELNKGLQEIRASRGIG